MHPIILDENNSGMAACKLEPIATKKIIEKCFRFDELAKFRRIQNFSQDEKKMIWIPEEDLRRIQKDCLETVEMSEAENGLCPCQLDDSELGLKAYRTARHSQRTQSRLNVHREVFLLQDFHFELYDLLGSRGSISNLIAVRCNAMSMKDQEEAYLRALEDAHEAL